MANRTAPALALRDGDHGELTRMTRSPTVPAGVARRARIVLLAAAGLSNSAIADKIEVSRPTVIGWRNRYAAGGIAGLANEPRPGRPRTVDRREVVAATLSPPPKKYGVTHWSSRLLGRHLGIGNKTVATAWREYGIQPCPMVDTFKFSTNPELVAKVTGIVGLYLNPPDHAIMLCVDEKSQIQARESGHRTVPVQPGPPDSEIHDDRRHGTSALFAALEIATGELPGSRTARRRHQQFLAFLKQAARAHPEGPLRLVMNNDATQKNTEVRTWLAANPGVHVHFTPTSGSWLNLVEVWLGIINHQPIHRGSIGSDMDLNAKIRAFIDAWTDRCRPFVWTKSRPSPEPQRPLI